MARPSRTAVPLVDLAAQHGNLRGELLRAFEEVLDSGEFVKGAPVSEFEASFAKYVNAPAAAAVGNGTDALILTLRALGIGPGDEVVVPAFTFAATAEAPLAVGAQLRFADVEAATLTMTPATLERAITAKTKLVVPVHIFGHPADPPGLTAVAAAHGVEVVFDAAQSHGALWCGRSIADWGRASCYSFYPGKNLGALGDGGAVVSPDPDLVNHIRRLADHGRDDKYEHLITGYNSRLDTVQAAFLLVKLRYVEEWTAKRRQAAMRYRNMLEQVEQVRLLNDRMEATSVYHLFVVRVADRDNVVPRLKQEGVTAGVHYPIPLHKQSAFNGAAVASEGCPESEKAAQEVLSLPLYPEISPEQQERVVEVLLRHVS